MKPSIGFLLPVLLFFSVGPIHADTFQIVEGSGGNYCSYAQVFVGNKAYGHTDKYGRIKIDLPKGTHSGQVDCRGKRKAIVLKIDGAQQLKKVNAQ